MNFKKINLLISSLLLFLSASAQKSISYLDFMDAVSKNHQEYLAMQMNRSISELAVEAAKVFPDPSWSFSWIDNGQRRSEMGYGFTSGLSWEIALGAKRKARVSVAEAEKSQADLELQLYFQTLRQEATVQFLTVLKDQQIEQYQQEAYLLVKELADADSLRLKLGELSALEARQSALESFQAYTRWLEAKQELGAALRSLYQLMGATDLDILPTGHLQVPKQLAPLEDFIQYGLALRPEVLLAKQGIHMQHSILNLLQANRKLDIEVHVELGYNSYVRNVIAPTPAMATASAGIAIPLKFSNRNLGELKAQRLSIQQQQTQLEWTSLVLRKEIQDAYLQTQQLQEQVQRYESGILLEADKILEGVYLKYKAGDASIFELLTARQQRNELQVAYLEKLFEYAAARVSLEQSSPQWGLQF